MEAIGLSEAININVIHSETIKNVDIKSPTFLSSGHIERIAEMCAEIQPDILIFDGALTPVQQRNLEEAFNVKVIDRTGLILEIFGERAQTKEGKLQVELAALDYQRSRLVRSWTHLERQRGGFGFMGGPGETQIEIDRRLIGQRLVKIKKDLQKVRNARALQSKSRAKVPYPVIALVGYTNAGKSTLFNTLTKSKVYAEDALFATLDPTTRRVKLPSGKIALFSDTVGFITDLPTQLIEAFQATLEQVEGADIILHISDRAAIDFEEKQDAVLATLEEIGIEEDDPRIIHVWNKSDLLDIEQQSAARRKARFTTPAILVSAITKQGVGTLLDRIDETLFDNARVYTYTLPVTDGKALAFLKRHGDNQTIKIEASETGNHLKVSINLSGSDADIFEHKYGYS